MNGLNEERLRGLLGDFPWQVEVAACVDSTNTALKNRAREGLPTGTVLLTGRQTGGRGRLGRQFASPSGGIYLSVLLRPQAHLRRLTAVTAAAVRRAITTVCGVQVGVKWRNDLLLGGKKVCGILAEVSFARGALDYAVVGIGINCNTDPAAFPPEVRQIATSLAAELGESVDETALAAAVIRELYAMDAALPEGAEDWMADYAAACVTLGKPVRVLRGQTEIPALAVGMDADGGLLVRYEDGKTAVIDTGEVSVRGLNGYI